MIPWTNPPTWPTFRLNDFTPFRPRLAAAFVSLLALMLGACTQAGTAHEPVVTELSFINHLAGGMAEQDIFVSNPDDPTTVLRIAGDAEVDEALRSQPALGSGDPIEHDPFGLSEAPLGPFPAGPELGFTVGAWLDATGGGTYTVTGDTAEIDVWFEGLVPNGVYTLWCSEVHTPPNFQIIDRPCGAPDGSENGFVADAEGKGSLEMSLPTLPKSSETKMQVLAPAYHADGKHHGAEPGDFGTQTHVQLMHMLMPAEG